MAAFAVIFYKNGRDVPNEVAAKMRQSLKLFGPDRDHIVTNGRFGLAWTFDIGYTPQDRFEFQPVDGDGRWLLVFVGFLMHREELARKLNIAPETLPKIADCNLVMAAWKKWGDNCLPHLYGTFSFVICDIKEQRIFAARGCERGANIYIHEDDERIILSTSTKAIFCFPDIAKQVDETRIADALILNYEDRQRSYFKNINILARGQLLRANPERTEITAFHNWDDVPDIRYPNDDDYVEAARELLAKSVSSSMRANETPAISLSAGLDSSAVLLAMLDELKKPGAPSKLPVKAYVSVPDASWDGRERQGRLGDESGPVRALMKKYPELDVEFVDSGGLPFDYGLDEIQSYSDMPIRGVGNLNWGRDISQRCQQAGRRVRLSGSSGNIGLSFRAAPILFGMWFRQGRWLKLLRENNALNNVVHGGQHKYVRRLFVRALLPNMPVAIFDIVKKGQTGREHAGYHYFSTINPDFAEAMDVEERMAKLNWDDRYRLQRNCKQGMQKMFLRGGRDESGGLFESFQAMHRVQGRDPLGDRKILNYCCGIPDDQFFKDGVDRRLMKRMLKGRVPDEIMNAPRGDQAADWHSRMSKGLPQIKSELDRLADDPVMSGRLDIERMRKALDKWPDQTPLSAFEHDDLAILRYAIPRALAVARFINRAEGKN